MTDRIDPGLGWRLLKMGEVKIVGDQYRDGRRWVVTKRAGDKIGAASLPVRRRTAPRTIKGIATRATVICGTPDDARTTNMIRRESGLTEYDCERIRRAWDNMQVSTAKYIMLEIQREGEP